MKYICPMHPEIIQNEPRDCPECGMCLENDTISLETQGKYICPMHPGIIRNKPGDYPICGMA
jgi:Cu+-exporting ATPase